MMDIDFCKKHYMFPEGALVLCAVSGGKDSMYLLANTLELAPAMGISVACAHFDHRLRGEESDRDREFVKDYCKTRGVDFYVGSADVSSYARENGLGVEEAARHLRYEFLEETAEKIGADKIATAHTADDNAETLLLNLSRGSGLKGLCAIPPVRGKIIRPMLTIGSDEVLKYLEANGILYVEDSTNALDCYARNRIRHNVIPLLRQQNRSFDSNVSRCISLLREDEDYLSSLAQDFVSEHYKNGVLPVRSFCKLERPVSSRVLQLICGSQLSYAHIEAIRDIAYGKDVHASADIPGMSVLREYGSLVFGSREAKAIEPRKLEFGTVTPLSEAKLEICCNFIPKCDEIHNSFNIFSFKHDSICGIITVKSRSDGEAIRLNGRKCTKTLKKLFSEAKLNDSKRGLVPVLCDEKGVIAVYGFGIAERCCPEPGDDIVRVDILPIRNKDTSGGII